MFHRHSIIALLLFLAGFLLYLKTVEYQFTLDDKLYITENRFVKEGWNGLKHVWTKDLLDGYEPMSNSSVLAGGRYRPLALTLHIAEEEWHGNDPAWGHFLNALIYGLSTLLCFWFFKQVFCVLPPKQQGLAGTSAALLFLVHPLHIEVVANIRNRDEMLATLMGISGILFCLRYLKNKNGASLLLGALAFFLAFATKESAVNFVGLLILVLWFLKPTLNYPIKRLWPIAGVLLISILAFFLLRASATAHSSQVSGAGELLNQVYLQASAWEKTAGIVFIYGLMLKLLIVPYPLTHDYYPFYPFRSFEELMAGKAGYPQWHEWEVLLSALLILTLLGLMVISYFRAAKTSWRLICFSLALFFGSTLMYSNIFFEIGSFFNERFLFIASLSFSLLAGYSLAKLARLNRTFSITLLTAVTLVFTALTWQRTADWRNDNVLVLNDVDVSAGSARANLVAAEASLDLFRTQAKPDLLKDEFKTYSQQGIYYGERALKIYPQYLAPLDILGNLYFEEGKVKKSFELFLQFYQRKPEQRVADNMRLLIQKQKEKGNMLQAAQWLETLADNLVSLPQKAAAYNDLGQLYGASLGNLDKAITYFKVAIQLQGDQGSYFENLGVALAMTGQHEQAQVNFLKALELGLRSRQLFINLGLSYQQLGNQTKANYYFSQSEQLQ